MHFFALDDKNGINLGSVASYQFAETNNEPVVNLKMYDRSITTLKGEQVERFRRALAFFTLGLVEGNEHRA